MRSTNFNNIELEKRLYFTMSNSKRLKNAEQKKNSYYSEHSYKGHILFNLSKRITFAFYLLLNCVLYTPIVGNKCWSAVFDTLISILYNLMFFYHLISMHFVCSCAAGIFKPFYVVTVSGNKSAHYQINQRMIFSATHLCLFVSDVPLTPSRRHDSVSIVFLFLCSCLSSFENHFPRFVCIGLKSECEPTVEFVNPSQVPNIDVLAHKRIHAHNRFRSKTQTFKRRKKPETK